MSDYISTETGLEKKTKHLETTMQFKNKYRGNSKSMLLSANISHDTSCNMSQSSTPREKQNATNFSSSTPKKINTLGPAMRRELSNVSINSVNSTASQKSTRSRSKIPVRNNRSRPASRATSRPVSRASSLGSQQ